MRQHSTSHHLDGRFRSTYIAVRPSNSGSRDRRYRGDRGGDGGQVFTGRRTSLRAGSASQVFARSGTASVDKGAGHGPEDSASVGHAFKTDVGARAPRRVRFPSASAWRNRGDVVEFERLRILSPISLRPPEVRADHDRLVGSVRHRSPSAPPSASPSIEPRPARPATVPHGCPHSQARTLGLSNLRDSPNLGIARAR